jgi:hypothetical protein
MKIKLLNMVIGFVLGLILLTAYTILRERIQIAYALNEAGLAITFVNGEARVIPQNGYCDPKVNAFCSVLKGKETVNAHN